MMLLILHKTPIGCVDYLLKHTNKKYLSKQVLEIMQLLCSAGYSDVYDKIPQGKEIQNWIKSSHTNEMYLWIYLNYVFYLEVLTVKPETLKKYLKIYQDFTDKAIGNIADSTDIKSAIFRYKKEYESFIPSNTELPVEECIKEYRKYLDWKIKQNPEYFKKDISYYERNYY